MWLYYDWRYLISHKLLVILKFENSIKIKFNNILFNSIVIFIKQAVLDDKPLASHNKELEDLRILVKVDL